MAGSRVEIDRYCPLGMTAAEWSARAGCFGWPGFRAGQVLQWIHGKAVTDPAAMTNLSVVDRKLLAERCVFDTADTVVRQNSEDGTIKLLLGWANGDSAETVMIPDGKSVDERRMSPERRTACVSSQVGCPVGCKFCASGMAGLKRSLTAAQIIEQLTSLNRILMPRGDRVTHVVFMGMGEPLANYNEVMQAVRIMHDPKCLNISARKITISTVGVPQRIRQLAEEKLPLNLALSLHAPNEPLRKQLIPWADHFGLEDILDSCRHYFDQTGREITLEYILLSGVNDRPEHARQLLRLCRSMRANVNLLRYNEVAGTPFKRPDAESSMGFQRILQDGGVNAHLRRSRGRDIDAACGQLRRKEQRPQLVTLGAS